MGLSFSSGSVSGANWRDKASGFVFRGPGSVGYGKVNPCKTQCPSGLSGIQAVSCLEVGKVLAVCANNNRLFVPLQPVPPLLQHQLDGKKLPVAHVVIPFGPREMTGDKWCNLPSMR